MTWQKMNTGVGTTTPTSPLTNLKWNHIGDSISDTSTAYTTKWFFQYISEKYNMDVVSYGIAATKLGSGSADSFVNRYQNMRDNVDIVTVLGGINDYGQTPALTLGAFADTTNASFYGSLHLLCKGLLTKYPNAKIMFITPMSQYGFWASNNDYNANGNSIVDYANAIKTVCSWYSIPVLDLCTKAGFTAKDTTQRTTYFYDGLHPKATGHKKMSIGIENALMDLFEQ